MTERSRQANGIASKLRADIQVEDREIADWLNSHRNISLDPSSSTSSRTTTSTSEAGSILFYSTAQEDSFNAATKCGPIAETTAATLITTTTTTTTNQTSINQRKQAALTPGCYQDSSSGTKSLSASSGMSLPSPNSNDNNGANNNLTFVESTTVKNTSTGGNNSDDSEPPSYRQSNKGSTEKSTNSINDGCSSTETLSGDKSSEATPTRCARRDLGARKEHPLDAASLISKLFFGWMFPFILLGWKRGLQRADLPEQATKSESCHQIGERLVTNWNKELKSCGYIFRNLGNKQVVFRNESIISRKINPSLVRVMMKTHWKNILLNSLLTIFAEVVCKSLSAYSVGQMLKHMNNREATDYPRVSTLEDPLVSWTLYLIIAICFWVLSAHFYGFQMMRIGLHIRVGCSYLIYRKSLKLGQHESSQTTMGKMINLLSNDLDKFNYVCIMVPFLWVGPIQTIVSIYLLWPILGLSCFGPILVLGILTPIQFYLSRKFASFRRRIAAYTDERVRLLHETITSLSLIKLYGWEYPFREAMRESRRKETDLINRVGIIKGISVALMYVSTKLVLFVTIIFHCLVFDHTLDARTLFMSMAMLNNVQFTMTQLMPRVVSLGVESLVSLARIQSFLLSVEFSPSEKLQQVSAGMLGSNNLKSQVSGNADLLKLEQRFCSKFVPFIELQNVGARWSKAETQTIDSISFKCEAPGLIIVCGQVASGKTSLLLTLMNELPISSGRARIGGTISYCSKKPWIFEGTVRENIIFGQKFDADRYRVVVNACALMDDLNSLAYGDQTYIQENSLSGGQKARVNLARCLYRDCDIYLLDDPLSALDARVGNRVFDDAIKRFLGNKLVIMCTNQFNLCPRSDNILLMDKGKQIIYSEFKELIRIIFGGDFEKDESWLSNEQKLSLSFLVEGLRDVTDRAKEFHVDDSRLENDEQLKQNNSKDGNNSTETKTIGEDVDKSSSSGECCEQRKQCNIHCANFERASESTNPIGKQISNGEYLISSSMLASKNELQINPNLYENYRIPSNLNPNTCSILEDINSSTNDSSNQAPTKAKKEALEYTSIHAPYGSQNLPPFNDGDKILITSSDQELEQQQAKEAETHGKENGFEIKEPFASTAVSRALARHTHYLNLRGEKEDSRPRSTTKVNNGSKTKSTDTTNIPRVTSAAHYRLTSDNDTRVQQLSANCISQERKLILKEESSIDVSKERRNSFGKKQDPGPVCHSDNRPSDEDTSSCKLSGLTVWYKYYTQTSTIRLTSIVLTFLVTQALFSTADIYLTVWSMIEQNRAQVVDIFDVNQHQIDKLKLEAADQQVGGNLSLSNVNDGTHVINYDMMPNMATFAIQTIPILFSRFNSSQILEVDFSPLSPRSSQKLTSLESMGNIFTHMTGLFYNTNITTTISPSICNNYMNYQQKDQQQMNQQNQIVSSINESANLFDVADRNILEESEALFNVKSIYKPLYRIVNSFTSGQHALTYTILLSMLFACSAFTNVLSLTSSNKSAIALYKKLTDNALFAKIAFFDQNPVGRFLNRATRDIGIIDEAIPYNANQAYDALLQTAATFIVVAAVDINLALPSLIVLLIFMIYHAIHIKSAKDIQRFEGIARSPIISHISTTLNGLQTIRSANAEHRFEQMFIRHQDAHTSIFLLYLGCNRSMAIILDSLNATYTTSIALWAVISGLSGPSAGLIITSAMLLSGLTQHGVMKLTETESLMTSVERVIEYCSLPQEENYDSQIGSGTNRKGKASSSREKCWLKEGIVEYKQVDLYYNRLDKPVLKNISFKLNAGEKIGIVGRTGAGKSSIVTTLFRLYDFEGTILIDGIDIKKIDLIKLRTAISIIPQNPIMFSTTIRRNLDPFDEYDDYVIWRALEKAHLRQSVSSLPGKLDYNIIGDDGGRLSTGQRQLMSLARVLLRQSPLIVMDEATANVDPSMDAIIQTTIRSEFKHCTVITIAHRLETILDCDRIMVLESGKIVDFDSPDQLLARGNNHFCKLVQKSTTE